jgi:hypothetical protein
MRVAIMFNLFNNLVDSSVAGINRLVNFLKLLGGSSDVPLADVLVISRVLFAVVMIGFIGYQFDRTKQTLKRSFIARK